jgi:hypothetical protein
MHNTRDIIRMTITSIYYNIYTIRVETIFNAYAETINVWWRTIYAISKILYV